MMLETPNPFVFAETLDYGFPQNTESDTLKMYVTTEEIKYNPVNVSYCPR
jgi:hypothetical protein